MTQILATFVLWIPLLASAVEGLDVEMIARNGIVTAVLAWFMLRAETLLKGIKHQMAGLNRTMLIQILSQPTTSSRGRIEAHKELYKEDPDLAREFGSEPPGD